MRVIHDKEFRQFEDYYVNTIQNGSGLPVFKEYRSQKGGLMPLSIPLLLYLMNVKSKEGQRGDGFASLFKGIFRYILPVAKSVGKSLAKTAMHTGIDIVRDVSQGHSLKDAASTRLQEVENKLLDKTKEKVDKLMSGSGRKKLNKKEAFQKKLFSLIKAPKSKHIKRLTRSNKKVVGPKSSSRRIIHKWI